MPSATGRVSVPAFGGELSAQGGYLPIRGAPPMTHHGFSFEKRFADGGEVPHKANGGISYSGDFSTPDYYQVYNALPNAGFAGQFVQRMFPNPSTTGAYDAYMKQLASNVSSPPPMQPYLASARPVVDPVVAPFAAATPPASMMPTNNVNLAQFNSAPNAQQLALAPPKMVQPETMAHGGEVDAALHAVRHHLAGGGFLSDLFSGPDYLSTGEVASPTNWGDPEVASDFFKADRALRLAREVQAPMTSSVPDRAPLTAPRPVQELPVNIPFAAPDRGVSMLSSDISPASVTSLPLAYSPEAPAAPAAAAINQATGKLTARVDPNSDVERADNIWNRMLIQESGGRQFRPNGSVVTSPVGALGISQVMPSTGPEAAQLAGLPWSLERLRNDPEYNHALGRAYYEAQLERFGDPILAAAAYNGGPGRVAGALRQARETGQPWTAFLRPETQNYVRVVGRAEGGEVEGYDKGGIIKKALGVLAKSAPSKVVTDPAERAVNLKKFHSTTPEEIATGKWYHGTAREVPGFANDRPAFVTTNPKFASRFAEYETTNHAWDEAAQKWVPTEASNFAPNVMPLHVRAENPWDHTNPDHVQAVLDRLYESRPLEANADRIRLMHGDWENIERPYIQKEIKALGHDAFFVNEGGNRNLAVYSPANQFKSATGNAGTFDPDIPRLEEAHGGEVDGYDGGGLVARALRAWHGSPYKFNKFDASKGGTGEGQQVYGKGGYFAQDKSRALDFVGNPEDRYRRFSGQMSPKEEIAFDMANQPNARDMDIMTALARKYGDNITFDEAMAIASDAMKKRGTLYEVDITQPKSQFLHWQKPLLEQSPEVQKLLTPEALGLREALLPGGKNYAWVDETGLPVGSAQTMRMPEAPFQPSSTGRQIYNMIGHNNPDRATNVLRDVGVAGNTYVDPKGFGLSAPPHNYVVFNPERDVDILNQYAHGGLVDDALHVVREHHADGEAVGPVATDNSERVRAAESAANLAKQIQAYEASMASIRQQPQDIQSMTHAPEKPRAPISVEALGKNREFGSAPYDVAGPLSSFAQGAYDMKTLPLYMYPPTAPLGMAIDAVEGVASGSPTQVAMSALGGPLKVARNVIAPLAVATGVTAPDEAEAAKVPKLAAPAVRASSRALTPAADMTVDQALDIIRRTSSVVDPKKDPRFWHNISSNKLATPLDEMAAEYKVTDPAFNIPIKTPSDYEGKAFVSASGDPTLGGADLIEVNGQKLITPTKLQAGPSFTYGASARGPDKAVWASDLPIMSAVANRAEAAHKAGFDPYLNYIKMGGESPDYSHHISDTLLDLLKQSKVTKGTIEDFDTKMKKGFSKDYPAYPDWPGLNSPDLQDYLYKTGPGKSRTAMAKLMASGTFQKLGMPDVAAVRFATIEPRLLNSPNYSSGSMIARMDPFAKSIRNPAVPHKTYGAQLAAHPEGADPSMFAHDVPLGIMHNEWVNQQLAKRPDIPASNLQYIFSRENPTVYWRPENVDRVSRFLDLKQRGLIP